MLVKISYFIFGIITFATGKPARYDTEDSHFSYVHNEHELQKLLQSLANKGTYEVASNYKEDRHKGYHENRAGASRYDERPSQLYYHNDQADSPQYDESRENADEKQPSINSLQIISQSLENNANKPGYVNGQNLLQDLLSLNRNNKFKLLKPNDDTDNVNEVIAFLGDLQKKVADERYHRNDYVYSKASGENLRGKLFLGEIDEQGISDQDKPLLVQPKDGVMKLVENIVGYKPRHHELDYVSVLDGYSDRDNLRCNGKNCARADKADNDSRLRCRGKNCARTRNDDDDIKYNSKLSAQKVKLNDELDAVVLGLSDVEHLMTKLNIQKQPRANKLRGAKLFENVELENLLNSKGTIGKKGNVEAVVFDLTQVENGDSIARQIKQLLSQPTNEGSYDDYEEYGNVVEEHLKQGVYDIDKQVGTDRAKARIMPHKENNNNVYLPQWLLDEVLARTYGEKEAAKERTSLFPLTRQQKERFEVKKKQNTPRIYRRNFEQDIGVPFHLEVQGLGQVNP